MISKHHLAPAATLIFIAAPLTFAQTQGCMGIDHLGAYPDKPFTGEFRTVDTSVTFRTQELVARDREGRIREARSAHFALPQGQHTTTLTMPDGTTRSVTSDEQSEVLMIFDCSAGVTIQILPAMRIARTKQGQPPASPPTLHHQFSSGFCPSAGIVKPNPHLQYEELGFREFQGIVAKGCRYTTLGSETDGEWEGKPIRSDEQWVSDDLAAFLLILRKDLITGKESRIELSNIKLGDPDPELFKIPDGYLVNPTEMPKVFLSDKSHNSSPN